MKRSDARTGFLNDLLTDALEGGITSQWARYVEIQRDADLNVPKAVLCDAYEPVKELPSLWTVTIDTMAKGLGIFRKDRSFFESCGDGMLLLADRTNGDVGDYDAIDADAILQLGLFGEVIYG